MKRCRNLRNQHFRTFCLLKSTFLVYQPSGNGAVDSTGIQNIMNAANARIGTEAYVTPQPLGSKQGYQQFDETYQALQAQGISLRTLWLQVGLGIILY